MLNGLDPIIIFQFAKNIYKTDLATGSKIPVSDGILSSLPLPFIPIYLSETLSGIYIDTEDKSIDIETTIDTGLISDIAKTNQRGIGTSIKITMKAAKGSIGLILFSALSDLVFPLVTSKEYAITYLHGAITVFSGLLHSLSINQESGSELYNISMELIKPPVSSIIQTLNVSAQGSNFLK